MHDFFNGEPTIPIALFGQTHILLLIGFILTLILLWFFAPKIRDSRYEKWFRVFLIFLVVIFEWSVFESRMLNTSLFRLPLCAVAIYLLTYAVAFKRERLFKIAYFYAFGSILSFLFFDTPWGLDRWGGWKFFGAHATIAWLAIYGYHVFGFKPVKKDFLLSFGFLLIYCLIAGYGTYKYGGSDELFLLTPPIPELNALVDIHQALYTFLFCLFGFAMLSGMYALTLIKVRKDQKEIATQQVITSEE